MEYAFSGAFAFYDAYELLTGLIALVEVLTDRYMRVKDRERGERRRWRGIQIKRERE